MRLAPLARMDARITVHRKRISMVVDGMQLVLSVAEGDASRYILRPIASSPQDGTSDPGTCAMVDLPGLLARLGAS